MTSESFDPADRHVELIRWDGGDIQRAGDELSVEEPLEIRVRGRAISVTMRTPGHDEELAAGFLLSEGIVKNAGDVLKVEPCGRNEFGNMLNVLLAPEVHVDFEQLTRHVFASSSCGVCGKATIESVCTKFSPLITDGNSIRLDPQVLSTMPQKMRSMQETFSRTGGLHAAALFDGSGRLIVLREDVGRHNAVDKVIGYALMNRLLPLDHHVLLVSGRASFEIVQKALAAQVPVVAAVSAPSSLAVSFARDAGITLIGFLREGRMNIYTHERRIIA
jgi:FdhD protein